jgi:hypothetical protein
MVQGCSRLDLDAAYGDPAKENLFPIMAYDVRQVRLRLGMGAVPARLEEAVSPTICCNIPRFYVLEALASWLQHSEASWSVQGRVTFFTNPSDFREYGFAIVVHTVTEPKGMRTQNGPYRVVSGS